MKLYSYVAFKREVARCMPIGADYSVSRSGSHWGVFVWGPSNPVALSVHWSTTPFESIEPQCLSALEYASQEPSNA